MPWAFGLVLKWHDNSELSPLGDASASFLTKRNLKVESWISEQKFPQKRRISLSHCSGSRKSKQPTPWGTSAIQNQLREKISLRMKKWIWWWQQNWNDATILLIWSTKLPSVEPWQDNKGEKILPPSGRLKNVFSGRQLGLVQEGTLVIFYTRMPREIVRTTWNEVEIRKNFSPGASILTNEKAWNCLKTSPVTKAENPLSLVGNMKISSCDYRHLPVCRGYKSGNRCICGIRCLYRHADGEK